MSTRGAPDAGITLTKLSPRACSPVAFCCNRCWLFELSFNRPATNSNIKNLHSTFTLICIVSFCLTILVFVSFQSKNRNTIL